MRAFVTIACLCLASLPAIAQQLPGNPAAGRGIAQRGCAQCHVIGQSERQAAVNGVPTFGGLARDRSMTTSRLQGFMQAPHPPMPDLALTRQEINDVTAYILSLRK
jgi:mono/diheme cytochrome c family protein